MDAYAELAASIHRVFPGSRLTLASDKQLADLRRDHPNAPAHYAEFLHRVGWGSLGGSNFMLYDGLVEPSEIYDPVTAAELAGLLLFGDDFGGWGIGFDTKDGWRLVGVDNGRRESLPERTLAEFIAQRIANADVVEPGD